MYLCIIKAIYDKPVGNIILNKEKLKSFPIKSGMRQVSNLPTLIYHSTGISGQSNKVRERNAEIQIRKEEVKLSLFANNIILHLRGPKDTTNKLINLINTFSNVAVYKINIQSQ
jgi:hypothetical protein